ncbi:MAG: RHS repeat-associated core domain-containing protein [Cyclobacteriaceae bacterium]
MGYCDREIGYRFGFNGKEKDDEWNGTGAVYDYGFRIYDARVAKFLSVDPLVKTYPYYSPFIYAGNSPIAFIDLDGLERVLAISFDGQGDGATNYRIGHLRLLNGEEISSKILTNDPATQLVEAFKEASEADENGIGFVAIWGHGTPNSQWGNNSDNLNKDDLDQLEIAIQNGDVNFTDNAIIYIGNCNAGTNDGNGESFAQKLADITGAKIVAGSTDDYYDPQRNHRGSVGVEREVTGQEMNYIMWYPNLDNFRMYEEGNVPVDLGGEINVGELLERGKTLPMQKLEPIRAQDISVSTPNKKTQN